MERADLEHLIRAAASLTNQYEFLIVGSQSILGAHPNAPASLKVSKEADMYPLDKPELSDVIDGALGEGSPFNDHFGYYAQGVGPETAKLPSGWKDRLVKVQNANTDLKIGYCLDPCDLAASKLVAGRDKDWTFVQELLRHDLVKGEVLLDRVQLLPIDDAHKRKLRLWVAARTPGSSAAPKVSSSSTTNAPSPSGKSSGKKSGPG